MGIKYLECPDIHKDPERGDIWELVSKSILNNAKKQEVDFVAFPGDFWKAVTTNDNKGGVDEAMEFIEELSNICPVVAIEGTPSHDSPGSYEVLKRAGLVLLEPGKIYGYYKDRFVKSQVKHNIIELDKDNPDAIIFGVPELNKNNIQAKLHLSAEEANGKAVELFENYMDSFVAPMRLKYKDIPAFMLFHGNVSDSKKENTSDIILKSSDIVIHSEVFERSNLTRVSLGHIHQPWESEKCNMGYAGSPGLKWGERDFIPAMNLIDSESNSIKRLPYGTPERRKVWKTKDIVVDPNIAYWIVSDDPEEKLPEGIHSWSRLTIDEKNNKATRRVTEGEIDKTLSLWELALKLDPELDPELKVKFDLLEEKHKKESTEKVDIQLDRVEVYGCKFFQGDNAILDISTLNNGLTSIGGEINGKQNGIGKSGILSFLSPYPNVVGKSNPSGRDSALKYYFNKKDSRIVKFLRRNGVEHKHVITIKAAHTKSGGKVECNLSINGEPQLDKGTFQEMFNMCESLYGSYTDYLLTSFYVQPLQGKSESSLMSASMTSIRDLVQGIAGIDRSKEKRFALDRLDELSKSLSSIESKIEYAKENLGDKQTLEYDLKNLNLQVKDLIESINIGNQQGLELKKELESLQVKKTENDKKSATLDHKNKDLKDVENSLSAIPIMLEDAKKELSEISDYQKKIDNYNSNKKIVDAYNSDFKEYSNYINNLNNLNSDKNKLQARLENIKIPNIEELKNNIYTYERDLKIISEWETENQDIKDCNSELLAKYNKDIQEYTIAKNDFDNKKINLENKSIGLENGIKSLKDLKEASNKKCPSCGYQDQSIIDKIKGYDDKITQYNKEYQQIDNELLLLKFDLVKPEYKPELLLDEIPLISKKDHIKNNLDLCKSSIAASGNIENQISTLKNDIQEIDDRISYLTPIEEPEDPKIILDPVFVIEDLKIKIENSKSLQDNVKSWENEIKSLTSRKETLLKDISEIKIDYTIDPEIEKITNEMDVLRQRVSGLREDGKGLEVKKESIQEKISDIELKEKEIQKMINSVSDKLQDKEDWNKIVELFSANKIPALELEIILDSIDMEATRILSPYQEGQYSFRAITQNDKGTDKFDILVHDALTGEEQSFLSFSPGVKSLLSDAYVKSLLRRRSDNTYNPTILDESDGPVGPKHVREYFDIQEQYFRDYPNKKVLIVSHKTESKAYIDNFIDIKEIRSAR